MSIICTSSEFQIPDLPRANRAVELAARCAGINEYQIFDTPTEPEFEDITKLAAAVAKDFCAARPLRQVISHH